MMNILLAEYIVQSKNSNANIFIHFDSYMDCAICLTLPDNPEIVPCCQQAFCSSCLQNWVSVRNCCPLCIAPIGSKPLNQLKHNHSQEFDNGGLMLESELASIVEKINFLRMIYLAKKENASNIKSNFPKAHLNFVEEEMRGVEENLEIAQLSVTQNDRVTATATIQNMAEVLLDVEAILMGESTVQFECEDYSDEEDQYYDSDEFDEEIYVKTEKTKGKGAGTKANSKKKIRGEV